MPYPRQHDTTGASHSIFFYLFILIFKFMTMMKIMHCAFKATKNVWAITRAVITPVKKIMQCGKNQLVTHGHEE